MSGDESYRHARPPAGTITAGSALLGGHPVPPRRCLDESRHGHFVFDGPGTLNVNFTSVWDVVAPENQGRLLRAVVQRVEADEPANKMKVALADLGTELPQEATA